MLNYTNKREHISGISKCGDRLFRHGKNLVVQDEMEVDAREEIQDGNYLGINGGQLIGVTAK